MAQGQSYKNRTVQVRRSARAHLKELRAQRIAKRMALAPSLNEPMGEPNTSLHEEDLMSDMEITAPQRSGPEEVSLSQVGNTENGDDSLGSNLDMVEPAPDEELSATDQSISEIEPSELSVENTAMSEMEELYEIEADREEANEEPIVFSGEQHEPEEAPASDIEESDLITLPGAGPGLVWILNQCGISSLADLANANTNQLSADMGIVGQIIDVEQWIAFAKEN